jgi:hypothetical protein
VSFGYPGHGHGAPYGPMMPWGLSRGQDHSASIGLGSLGAAQHFLADAL